MIDAYLSAVRVAEEAHEAWNPLKSAAHQAKLAFYAARDKANAQSQMVAQANAAAHKARAPLLAEQRRLLAIEEPSEAEAAEEAALHEALGSLSARQAEGE